VNGYSTDENSDNYILRQSCIDALQFDIIGLCETKLTDNNVLNIPGYQWFGNNRKTLHVNARVGSGGVGFLVKDSCIDHYLVNILDDNHDDVLWLKFTDKITGSSFCTCVCYLPPSNSTRNVDVNEFYDTLLSNVYVFQNSGPLFIVGDFNSRIGNNDDYIVGVDDIPSRDVVDFTTNAYGDRLVDFLIDTNMCILNGRNYVNNDYTSVSVKGSAVVDYCIVHQDNLDMFKDFSVIRSTEMLNILNRKIGFIPSSIPDHSILSWIFVISNLPGTPDVDYDCSPKLDSNVYYDKFDLKNVPDDFLQNNHVVTLLHDTVLKLEQSYRIQTDIDSAYMDICTIIKDEMYEKISHKKVYVQSSYNNKKRKICKPWWSERLSELWNSQCKAEREWLKSSDMSVKKHLKSVFITARRMFDREVQRSKRAHWASFQADLLAECENNQQEFWKSMGRIGIAQTRRKTIPMEVMCDDGSISSNIDVVLNKWKIDFSSLFMNRVNVTQNPHMPNVLDDEIIGQSEKLNDYISIDEVKKAITKAKLGKACGIDMIPVDILKSDNCVSFLHILYNVCFNSGCVPSEWSKVIISPIPKSTTADPVTLCLIEVLRYHVLCINYIYICTAFSPKLICDIR